MLAVPDVAKAAAYYRDVLGFQVGSQMDFWASVSRDGVELMFSLPNTHEPFEKPALTGSLYFACDDVDRIWAELKDKAPVVYPIENFDYGMREFAIRDPHGYILQFGQELKA